MCCSYSELNLYVNVGSALLRKRTGTGLRCGVLGVVLWKLGPGEEDTFERYFHRVNGGWPASQQPREGGHHLGPCDEVRRLFSVTNFSG
jgi:hypothetical protein